jgi:hypothetical protein
VSELVPCLPAYVVFAFDFKSLTLLYRMSQEKRAIFWEVIVSAIVSKKV